MKNPPIQSVCVFCGSSPGVRPEYMEAARALGQVLAANKIKLVYGGASVGLMGAVADSVLEAGGEVIGVIPKGLFTKEVAHSGLTDLRVVGSMHERKAMMADLSDAFIALPGGCGTFEEFFEILTWAQLGLHQKPMGILNIKAYYQGLLALVDHGVTEGFIRAEHRTLIVSAETPTEILKKFGEYQPLTLPKWIRSGEET